MTKEVDLKAAITPSISCGEIFISSNFCDCEFLQNAKFCEGFIRPGIDTANSDAWMYHNFYSKDGSTVNGIACYYKNDVIRLYFNSSRVLYFIAIRDGYTGKVFGNIGIGSTLRELKQNFEIEYDSGDEVYYPSEDSGIVGVSFSTGFAPSIELDDDELFSSFNEEKIIVISIHDWSLDDS
jgi:hypothetical protein